MVLGRLADRFRDRPSADGGQRRRLRLRRHAGHAFFRTPDAWLGQRRQRVDDLAVDFIAQDMLYDGQCALVGVASTFDELHFESAIFHPLYFNDWSSWQLKQ